jgi:hypothetical protein
MMFRCCGCDPPRRIDRTEQIEILVDCSLAGWLHLHEPGEYGTIAPQQEPRQAGSMSCMCRVMCASATTDRGTYCRCVCQWQSSSFSPVLVLQFSPNFTMASFSSRNWEEKHCIRIPVAFRLYLVKIIQILTN